IFGAFVPLEVGFIVWRYLPARLRAARGWRISGQNSRTTFVPAFAPREIPLVESPLENVCKRAGCQSLETKPPATAPETRPGAIVGLPVVFFLATTVLTNA